LAPSLYPIFTLSRSLPSERIFLDLTEEEAADVVVTEEDTEEEDTATSLIGHEGGEYNYCSSMIDN